MDGQGGPGSEDDDVVIMEFAPAPHCGGAGGPAAAMCVDESDEDVEVAELEEYDEEPPLGPQYGLEPPLYGLGAPP